jgi:hypothetical protein
VKYLQGTINYGLIYKRDSTTNMNHVNPILISSCDANHAEIDAVSTTGYCIQVMDKLSYIGEVDTIETRSKLVQPHFNVISYVSKRQKTVTDSSTYSEYIAVYSLTKEIMYKSKIMLELGFDQSSELGMIIFCDNESV